MRLKVWILTMVLAVGGFTVPFVADATHAELRDEIEAQYASGGISDPDVYQMLKDVGAMKDIAPTQAEEQAYHGSIIDICNAFEGSGITSQASGAIKSKASQ